MSRIAALMKLLEVDPQDADTLYMIAQEHMKLGDAAVAVEWYDRCLAAEPGYSYAYFHKARAQQVTGDIAAARATLESGLKAARAAGDTKAQSEIAAELDGL